MESEYLNLRAFTLLPPPLFWSHLSRFLDNRYFFIFMLRTLPLHYVLSPHELNPIFFVEALLSEFRAHTLSSLDVLPHTAGEKRIFTLCEDSLYLSREYRQKILSRKKPFFFSFLLLYFLLLSSLCWDGMFGRLSADLIKFG